MIVLDENIGEDQRQLLRSWRIRTCQIGHEVGRQGMKTSHMLFHSCTGCDGLPFSHVTWASTTGTYVTSDTASYASRSARMRLRVSFADFCGMPFDSRAKRLGRVVLVGQTMLRVWLSREEEAELAW